MKIQRVQIFVLQESLQEPILSSKRILKSIRITLLKLTTDDGLIGWGQASHIYAPPGSAVKSYEKVLSHLLIGQDPLDIELLWSQLYEKHRLEGAYALPMEFISAVDMALWDIKGKALGLPVYKLLGGTFRQHIQAYATGIRYKPKDTNAAKTATDEALTFLNRGFKAVKMKIGGLSLQEDLRRVAAVRQAIGDSTPLMIDANRAYTAAVAIQMGRQVEPYQIAWYEEPLPTDDLQGYLQLKNHVAIPLACGEGEATRLERKEFLLSRAIDIVQPDLAFCGGISEARRLAVVAQTCGIQVIPHVGGSVVALAACIQFLTALPDYPVARNPQPFIQAPVLEIDQMPNSFLHILAQVPLTVQEGRVEVPITPGLGLDINEEMLQRYQEK